MMRSAVRTAFRVRTCAIRGGIRASTHPRQPWKVGMGLPSLTGVGLHNLAFMEKNCTLSRTPCISERTDIYQEHVAVGFESPNDEVPPMFFRFLKRCETVLRLFIRFISILAIWSPVAISSPIGLGLPFIPQTVSAQLREYWLRALLRVIELSGPTFIKAAQWASTRRDSFPEEVCKTLGRLHTFTRHRPIKYGEDAVEAAFGASWRQFLELEDKVLGSGAVAQVYKGCMVAGRYRGTPVAVKVIHPDVKTTVELDLSLIRGMVTLLEMFPRIRWLSLHEIVDEFGELMESQLDLQREAQNLERFAHDFEDDPGVVFPRPLYPWVTDTVLIEEYKEGEPISSFFGGNETKKLAQIGLNTFLKMVFVNNFVHGDLHPGNLIVGRTEDSASPQLIMLDAGIVCELDYGDRKNFVDLFYAVVIGNGKLAGRLMIERARSQRCKDPDAFCDGIHVLVQRARSSGLRLGQIQAGELLKRLFALCLQHEVKMESKFASIMVAIAVLEGVGRSLDPECNILQASLPVVTQASAMISGR